MANSTSNLLMSVTLPLMLLAFNCMAIVDSAQQAPNDDPLWRDLNFKRVDEICRLRGYNATDFFFISPDGYNITITRCTNPLIHGGRRGLSKYPPLMLFHGTLADSSYWVTYSRNARPKNYAEFDPRLMSERQLNRLVADDPARFNLCMLAMNFGIECWVVNRRGSIKSRTRVNGRNPGPELTKSNIDDLSDNITGALNRLGQGGDVLDTLGGLLLSTVEEVSSVVNGDYWEFSLDEQAKYDFPSAINLVLEKTGQEKVALVGHSAGSSIALMALASEPEIANNISVAGLYAPAAELGNNLQEFLKYILGSLLNPYIGPFPPLFVEPLIEAALIPVCSIPAADLSPCKLLADAVFGASGPNVGYPPGALTAFPKSVAVRELAHLSQSLPQNSTRMFKFGSKAENQARYGLDDPPAYDFAKIILKNIFFITGEEDGLVGPEDVRSIVSKMSFEPEVMILADGDLWNHISYFFNNNTPSISVIPTFKRLYRS